MYPKSRTLSHITLCVLLSIYILQLINANNVTANDTIKMSELEMLILSEIKKDNHVTRDKLA